MVEAPRGQISDLDSDVADGVFTGAVIHTTFETRDRPLRMPKGWKTQIVVSVPEQAAIAVQNEEEMNDAGLQEELARSLRESKNDPELNRATTSAPPEPPPQNQRGVSRALPQELRDLEERDGDQSLTMCDYGRSIP